jgi:hypothetical protein
VPGDGTRDASVATDDGPHLEVSTVIVFDVVVLGTATMFFGSCSHGQERTSAGICRYPTGLATNNLARIVDPNPCLMRIIATPRAF